MTSNFVTLRGVGMCAALKSNARIMMDILPSQSAANNVSGGTEIIRTGEALSSRKQRGPDYWKVTTVEIQPMQGLFGVTLLIPEQNGIIVTFSGAIKIRVT